MSTSSEVDQLIQNIEKETDIMQKVRLLSTLFKTHDVKVKDVAERLGLKSSYLCHLLRLSRLPEVVVDGYYSNTITLSHLFIISRVKDAARIMEVYEKVLAESLTVKKTEELVRDVLYGVKTQGEYLSPEERQLYSEKIAALRKNLNLNIIQTRIKSKIIFEIKGSLESTSNEVRSLLKHFEMRGKN